jgi:hypothetical protein
VAQLVFQQLALTVLQILAVAVAAVAGVEYRNLVVQADQEL